MGTQKGRNVEVYNSFELLYAVVNGDVVINRDYCETKEEQCKYRNLWGVVRKLTIIYSQAGF